MDQPTPPDGPARIDVANADLLLSTTRSVRKRLDFERPVEREVLLECLELAVQAPTASNRQTWRWMVVTEPELKAAIADIYREAAIPYLSASAANAETTGEGAGDGQDQRVFDSAMYLAENLEQAPAFVIPCLAEDLAKMDAFGASVAMGSICQAAWSFQLALRARGLGSTWTTLHLRNAHKVADLLDIPPGITQVALIPVAYTKGLDFRPAKRPPVAEITHWNHWDDAEG
jgi:nitroreductase